MLTSWPTFYAKKRLMFGTITEYISSDVLHCFSSFMWSHDSAEKKAACHVSYCFSVDYFVIIETKYIIQKCTTYNLA